MIMTLLISGVIIPLVMWALLYSKILDQYIEVGDGEMIMTETKAEAQRNVLERTLKSPWFTLYLIYASMMIFAGACSVNAFSLGDWFFSL